MTLAKGSFLLCMAKGSFLLCMLLVTDVVDPTGTGSGRVLCCENRGRFGKFIV